MFSIYAIGNKREMAGKESEPRNDYWTFYVVVNSNTKQSGWSLGGGVVFGFALLGTSSEWREKHIAYITPTITSTASASILTEMKRVVERKEKKSDRRIGFEILFLKLCTHPVHHSPCRLLLSVNREANSCSNTGLVDKALLRKH